MVSLSGFNLPSWGHRKPALCSAKSSFMVLRGVILAVPPIPAFSLVGATSGCVWRSITRSETVTIGRASSAGSASSSTGHRQVVPAPVDAPQTAGAKVCVWLFQACVALKHQIANRHFQMASGGLWPANVRISAQVAAS